MPALIARSDAIVRATASVPEGTCPMCHVVASAERLAERELGFVTLNRFPVRWGQLMIVLKRHVVTFSEVTDSEHAQASELCLLAARALERGLSPGRVFVTALGSASEQLPMTCPHLHWHAVPVGVGERARDVLTWQHGVLEATRAEWAQLERDVRRALTESGSSVGSRGSMPGDGPSGAADQREAVGGGHPVGGRGRDVPVL